MTNEPTDEALENLFVEETGFDTDDFPAAIFGFARAVLAKWGQPAQAAEPVAREPLTDAEIAEEIVERGVMDVAWPSQRRLNQFARAIERAHGITKEGGQHGTE